MISRISEIIDVWLGWCPQTRTVSRQLQGIHDETVDISPPPGNGNSVRTGLPKRYRDQVLVWAVFFTLVSVPFVAYFQIADLTRLLLCLGTIAGLVVFAFFGRWLWNSLEMLEKGMTIKTGAGEYIILFLIAGAIPLSVVLILAALDCTSLICRGVGVPRVCHGICLYSLVRVRTHPDLGAEERMCSDVR